MAVMSTCCCCFTPKTGTYTVGAICLAVGFVLSVGICFTLINIYEVQETLQDDWDRYGDDKNSTGYMKYALVDRLFGFQNIIEQLQTILIVAMVYYSFYTFASLFVTYGACTDIRGLLIPWIIMEVVVFLMQIAGVIIVFVYGKDDPLLKTEGYYIVAGLGQIVAFVIHVYWWMCPIALYQQMDEETLIEPLVPPGHPMYPSVLVKY